ncbi:MAG TPA: nitroreductase/quinone reductase family protein [Methylomirabilota bacterium]|nr:nitroreductase/quinone reductase family protein [Methylomirabilota bacterium]
MSDATTGWAREAEAEFFRTLNALVEPAVRDGFASPGLLPTGMVVLETTGAQSGLPRRVPLLATVLEGCLFVGTARGDRSHWIRNLRAEQRVRYWLTGREHRGAAFVFAEGAPRPATQTLPPPVRAVAEGLLPTATACGWQFVIISPERAGGCSAPGAVLGAAE